jgi:hypothetical protein
MIKLLQKMMKIVHVVVMLAKDAFGSDSNVTRYMVHALHPAEAACRSLVASQETGFLNYNVP